MQGMMGATRNLRVHQGLLGNWTSQEDLKKFDVPTLIIHGDDDQVVPIDAAGQGVGKARQECEVDRLSRRSSRHHRYPQGPSQRRSARLYQGVRCV